MTHPELDADRLDAFLALALRLASASGPIVRSGFRAGRGVEIKPDASPVTEFDRAVEARLREMIASAFPAHGVVGEEFGAERADAELVWVIDPIDGTKQFAAGLHGFATLIALTHRGRPVIGVIDQPVTGERWIGVRGRGTTLNGAPLRTRVCGKLSEAVLATHGPDAFRAGGSEAYRAISAATRWTVYGAGCHAYAMLAAGFIDVGLEGGNDPYDYLALVPVVEGAGGLITDWAGAPLGLDSGGFFVAAGDPRVHAAALALLSPSS